ncbi:MAG: hypothetical protein GY822_30415 [Deltaproteobacteria bacterium]|nr:hypothetical protein [Deltaproteobacteria bacterium]
MLVFHFAFFRGPLSAALLLLLSLGVFGCQHAPQRRGSASAEQRLVSLEQSFSRFVSASLEDSDLPVLGRFEVQRKKLERLRMRYLDVVRDAQGERVRIAAMVRVAELHLDLAARVRRIPYETNASQAHHTELDAQLSRWALPLEATGIGILHQISLDRTATHNALMNSSGASIRHWQLASSTMSGTISRNLSSPNVDGMHRRGSTPRNLPTVSLWQKRVALYLALHDVKAGEKALLSEEERFQLVGLLGEHGPYGAPRRLLDMGRLGQRSARR